MGGFTMNSYPLQIVCLVTFVKECREKENPNEQEHSEYRHEVPLKQKKAKFSNIL